MQTDSGRPDVLLTALDYAVVQIGCHCFHWEQVFVLLFTEEHVGVTFMREWSTGAGVPRCVRCGTSPFHLYELMVEGGRGGRLSLPTRNTRRRRRKKKKRSCWTITEEEEDNEDEEKRRKRRWRRGRNISISQPISQPISNPMPSRKIGGCSD